MAMEKCYGTNLLLGSQSSQASALALRRADKRMQTQTTIVPAAAFDTRFHQMWPWAAVIFALGINVAWVALLGYELVSFIKFTF